MRPSRQSGFSLIEVLVAAALTIGVLLAATTAVANALHGAALAAQSMALHDDALSVLSDVRAISAYDDMSDVSHSRLRAMVGRTASMNVTHSDGSTETVSVTITQPPGAINPVAAATATANGISATDRVTLSVEAPTPGSSVNQ